MTKHSNGRLIGIFIVGIILTLGAVYVLGGDIIGNQQVATPVVTNTPTTNTNLQTYNGDLTVKVNAFDTQDSTIEYGEDTETTTIFYKQNSDGKYQKLIGTTGSALPYSATFYVDNTIKSVFVETSVKSGQDFYIDAVGVLNANSKIIGNPQWLDLDNNGRKTYVFQLDVTGYNANPNIQPSYTFQLPLIDEGSFALDTPTNVDVTNTGKQRCEILWSFDATASGDGIAVTKLTLTSNSTTFADWDKFESYWEFPTGQLPNSAKQKYYLNEFIETELASTVRYDMTFGSGDLDTAHFLIAPLNGAKNFEIPAVIWVDMDSVGTGSEWTAKVTTKDVHGNESTSSDAVVCN